MHISGRSGPRFEALSGRAVNGATIGWVGPCWQEVLGSGRGHELHVGPQDLVHQHLGAFRCRTGAPLSPQEELLVLQLNCIPMAPTSEPYVT